jgi:hypothetical protein
MSELANNQERSKRERFESYRRGWKCGARSGYRDKRFDDHERADLREAYSAGYERGHAALLYAMADRATMLDYDPLMSILRGEQDD